MKAAFDGGSIACCAPVLCDAIWAVVTTPCFALPLIGEERIEGWLHWKHRRWSKLTYHPAFERLLPYVCKDEVRSPTELEEVVESLLEIRPELGRSVVEERIAEVPRDAAHGEAQTPVLLRIIEIRSGSRNESA